MTYATLLNSSALALRSRAGDWASIGAVVAGGILIAHAAGALIVAPPRMQVLAIGGVILPLLFFIEWRTLVKIVLFWIIFEAMVRRYIVNDVALFFIKDGILAVAYVKAFAERFARPRPLVHSSLVNIPLALLVSWSVIQVFNPALLNKVVGLLGLRVSFWYVPLLYIAGDCFRTPDQLLRFLRRYVQLGIVICLFGFAQWLAGPGAAISKSYVDFSLYTAGRLIVFRSMSTFASNGSFAEYVLFIVLFGLVCARSLRPEIALGKAQQAVLAVSVAAAVVATGQIALVALIPLYLVYMRIVDPPSVARRGRALRLIIGIAVLSAIVVALIPVAIGTWQRLAMFADPMFIAKRLVQHVLEPIPRALSASIFGHGTGSQSAGLRYLFGNQSLASLFQIEGGYAKAAWELGIVGLILVPALHVALAIWSTNIRRLMADPDLRRLASAGVLLQITVLLWLLLTPPLDHSGFAILFWTTMGIVGALPRLAARSRTL